jgi:hypothetical protein
MYIKQVVGMGIDREEKLGQLFMYIKQGSWHEWLAFMAKVCP